jgi:diguanylate cyclase (GGDEF)-like protein
MNDDPRADPPGDHKPAKPLTKVLGQSEAVKGLVDEAAQQLSVVSAVLRQEVSDPGAPPGIESVLEKTETIEDKVQDAADKLSDVNEALKQEIRERHVLEFRLAAVTERAESSRNAAFHDLLTGLPNRALFNDRLEHGLAQARRHARSLAVMFIDLDGFKQINDSHGHDVGDAVLKTIAARLLASTRDEDTVSRQGGDEFLYLLTEVENTQGLTQIAEKLLAAIHMPCNLTVDAVQVDVCLSASIGISVFPQHGATARDLIRSADKAMYRAKAGKTRIALHDAVSPLVQADP